MLRSNENGQPQLQLKFYLELLTLAIQFGTPQIPIIGDFMS